jgi:ankyrin repeat protein
MNYHYWNVFRQSESPEKYWFGLGITALGHIFPPFGSNYYPDIDSVIELLSKPDNDIFRTLEYYIQDNNLTYFKAIISHFSVDINYNNHAALKIATSYGHIGIMVYLLTNCQNVDIDYLFKIACGYHCRASVELLIRHGANVHADNEICLKYCIRHGDCEIVEMILDSGTNYRVDDDILFRLSIYQYQPKLIKIFLDMGANIHSYDDCAIRYSARYHKVETVKFLLDHGADIHINDDEPIVNAVKSHNYDKIALLLNHGADIRAVDRHQIDLDNELMRITNLLLDNNIQPIKIISSLFGNKNN